MTPLDEQLRNLLEARDIAGFLVAYERYRRGGTVDVAVTGLTQRLLPPLLRQALENEQLRPDAIVRLYRLVRDSRLVLVDNALIVGINQRINAALQEAEPAASPVPPLMTFEDINPAESRRRHPAVPKGAAVKAVEVRRVAIVSTFTVGTWPTVDEFDCRKNYCASQQEREFLRAVRQYFPSLQSYPNAPLKNFINIEQLGPAVHERARRYAVWAQVDVLLCTADEDPVAGIELDSPHHDAEDAAERDELKNLLFQHAGLPLVRIRAGDPSAVRAEDFYDLLVTESKRLDELRPRRLRPRRTHDFLVPAEVVTKSAPLRTELDHR